MKIEFRLACFTVVTLMAACSGKSTPSPDAGAPVPHVIILVQENHSFDTYFGRWCTATPGSNPACTSGPSCCEAAPTVGANDAGPFDLTDAQNGGYDPNHSQLCETVEVNDGGVNQFASGPVVDAGPLWGTCEDPRNFAVADAQSTGVAPYRSWAGTYAIADRYFQSAVGASSENDMYLAGAHFYFVDNVVIPEAIGDACTVGSGPPTRFDGGTTIADVVLAAGATFSFYAEGYATLADARGTCPAPPSDCPLDLPVSPCMYSPGDDPFLFFPQFSAPTDNPTYIKDYAQLAVDIDAGQLPSVSFVKAVGYHTEHPGYGTTITAGSTFAQGLVNLIQSSAYAKDTLILITWDESGGFADHVPTPAPSTVDGEAYGVRIPLLAIGPYAKAGFISHTPMEHSSIVKFLEWDFTGKTGQLGARDAVVNNLGSMLDSKAVGVDVPEN